MKDKLSFKKNDEINLEIEDNGSMAEGIGRADGYSFFVKNVIKGERIRAVVTKLKKNYGYAKCISLIEASKDRVVPKCSYYKKCGGCNIQHMSYKKQLNYKLDKINSALDKIAGLKIRADEIIAADEEYRYRNKAQYPVGYSEKGEMIAGFYSERTHQIVEIADCILEPEINKDIIKTVLNFCERNKITAYNEEEHSGILRHIMIRHAVKTGQIMISLVINAIGFSDYDKLSGLMSELNNIINLFNSKNSSKYEFSSFVMNYNNKKTNVIMGDSTDLIHGKNYIVDEMNGMNYAISANSFYQVNHHQAEKLYREAAKMAGLKKTDVVFDMYCGTGTIGLYLSGMVKKVYGAEIVPEAIEMAKFNAKLNSIDNAEFFCGSADEVSKILYQERGIIPDVIVVDPPRKGCSSEMLRLMLDIGPDKILYISCDPATMARDLKVLCEDNLYRVEKVIGVDQFCQTFHVETVVLMSRVEGK